VLEVLVVIAEQRLSPLVGDLNLANDGGRGYGENSLRVNGLEWYHIVKSQAPNPKLQGTPNCQLPTPGKLPNQPHNQAAVIGNRFGRWD
jgi:hypothetical protein